MTQRYALKGINEEATECSVCGKVELKRVMWLVELDADGNDVGETFPVGTTCGSKLLKSKQSVAKLNTAIKNFASALYLVQAEAVKVHPRYPELQDLKAQLEKATQGQPFTARRHHPLNKAQHDVRDAIWTDVKATVTSIAL